MRPLGGARCEQQQQHEEDGGERQQHGDARHGAPASPSLSLCVTASPPPSLLPPPSSALPWAVQRNLHCRPTQIIELLQLQERHRNDLDTRGEELRAAEREISVQNRHVESLRDEVTSMKEETRKWRLQLDMMVRSIDLLQPFAWEHTTRSLSLASCRRRRSRRAVVWRAERWRVRRAAARGAPRGEG